MTIAGLTRFGRSTRVSRPTASHTALRCRRRANDSSPEVKCAAPGREDGAPRDRRAVTTFKTAPVSRCMTSRTRQKKEAPSGENETGAGDGLRTRYLDLGKVALHQVSYSRSVS